MPTAPLAASGDLRVPPGPGVPAGLVVPGGELHEQFSRSSGPGGQGVNTTDSRVQLTWSPASSAALTESQQRRLVAALGAQVSITASETRSQKQNRALARGRLADAIREALAPPPAQRRATKPTRGSQRRRIEAKKQRGQIKAARRRPSSGE